MGDPKNNSLAIFKAQAGLQAGAGVGQAYQTAVFAELQAKQIASQMTEINTRTEHSMRQIRAKGETIASEQEQAFIQGGVDIEGSAMDVIADTMADTAEAAYIRRRESDYQLTALAGERAAAQERGSNLNILLNSAASVTNAYAGYKANEFNYNRTGVRNRGTARPKTKGIE